MILFTVLIIVLILILIDAIPVWSHSKGWGYWPGGIAGLLLLIVLVILLLRVV